MIRRRQFVVVMILCLAAGSAIYLFSRQTESNAHLKQSDITGSKVFAADSPYSIHGLAYDEVCQLQAKTENDGGDVEAINRLLVLSRYSGFGVVRARACSGLGVTTNDALRSKVVDRLVECLRDQEGLVQICSCQSLARLEAKDKAPSIVPLLNSSNENVKKAAEKSLEKLGVVPPGTQPKQ